jgi:hypothetical protein
LQCTINCFFSSHFAPCGVTDANGGLPEQRITGFLPPGLVCVAIDFFLFDPATGGDVILCADGAAVP